MLTKRPPFDVEDPAELVHRRLTVLPRPPSELDPSVPEPLSRLVMKLLAKDPEDRYQSASGLAHDLAVLGEANEAARSCDGFPLASRDVPDRLRIPERLYGREADVAALIEAVDATAPGRALLMLIAGPSGVGKSSLVREVMRPVAGRRGHLVTGKFDQLNRARPSRAIGQAFGDLARKILGEPTGSVETLRRSLVEQMGSNAQVVFDVVPGFERLTRAASAISGKILVDDVVGEVIKASVMSAGATRALLLLLKGSEFIVRAEATGDGQGGAIAAIAFAGSGRGPERLVNFVVRTCESVVLDDAPRDDTYGDDPFVVAHRSHSILCVPLVDRGKLVGILYAKNALSRGAFTADRIRTLDMLASQAVISLENARLYQEVRTHAETLEIKVQERTRELEEPYARLRQSFGKYVPRRVAETIVSSRGPVRPTETVATVLYSDIQGFTGIVERMAPEQLIEMLNEYFPAVIGGRGERGCGMVADYDYVPFLGTNSILSVK